MGGANTADAVSKQTSGYGLFETANNRHERHNIYDTAKILSLSCGEPYHNKLDLLKVPTRDGRCYREQKTLTVSYQFSKYPSEKVSISVP